MEVYWLEQAEADVPSNTDWLGANETVNLNGLRFAKRRADWLLGRWTAKRAVAAFLNVPDHAAALASLEIRTTPCGAPKVFLANQPAAVTISLSHRAGIASCAIAMPGVTLGCDLEMIEPHSDAFVADYFTTEEQLLVAQASAEERWPILALLWSGKESALKALRSGLRLDTRCVIVTPTNTPGHRVENANKCIQGSALDSWQSYGLSSWSPLQVRYIAGQVFQGWWQQTGDLVRTVVATPPPFQPIALSIPAYRPMSASGFAEAKNYLTAKTR